MDTIFAFLVLLSPIGLIVSLIRPKLVSKMLKRNLTRKQILIGFISVFVISIIGFDATSPTKVSEVKESPISDLKSDNPPTETPTPTSAPTNVGNSVGANNPSENNGEYLVSRVIDGDTIELSDGRRVRYIGIDTPELNPSECYGTQATEANRKLVGGKSVRLVKDVSETDRYGRLLRYVYVGDTFVNDFLAREGYANASTYPPDVKYQNQFREAESEARNANKGFWSACSSTPTNTPAPQISTNVSESCKYSCTGADKDCSDFSTHAEAQTFFECCGFTATNDPMRLDNARGTGNGLACESLP